MVRAFNVFLLGCLILCGGTAGLILVIRLMCAAGLGAGIAVDVLFSVGLATLLPCSFLAAGAVFPGPPRPPSVSIWCPHCGMPLPVFVFAPPGASVPGVGPTDPFAKD